jgi:hypothetical protein
LCAGVNIHAATTTFSFTLDEPCKTSAGVYQTNGTLVRTLWNKVRYYAAGTYSSTWDGLDDNSNAVAPGLYQIRLLEHNTEYLWDGVIGNTSDQMSGPTVHRGFWFMQAMTISGTNAFYCSGYNEGQYGFRRFLTTAPQQVASQWFWDMNAGSTNILSQPGLANRCWLWTTSDTNWVYFGCNATWNPTNGAVYGGPGCIVAGKVSDNSLAFFTNGVVIPNGGESFPNGIYVGTQPGLSGLSVQPNGNLLAAAVAPDNAVYLINKLSGAPIISFKVVSPGRLNFSPDGSLWVCSSNSVVIQYTNLSVNPTVALTISGLSEPLDVAVNPANSNLILVADGGVSQQVKAFNNAGTSLWNYGLAGGYPSNGVAVATNKFWFSYEGVDQTFLCFAPDGSFWVGDEENHRALHFSAGRDYLEQIMYQPHSYETFADQNNPSRVFNQFLEFYVDYNKPLSQSNAWRLVNNWKVGLNSNNIPWNEGLQEVTTFTNGRTYALIPTVTSGNTRELCELGTNGVRMTGIFPMISPVNSMINSLGADGSARAATFNGAAWFESTLSGFDTNGNPLWNPETLLATASTGPTDPFPRLAANSVLPTMVSSNNILISFDASLNNGWHLGGIRMGGTNWLWKTSPAGALNGLGNYEISNGLTYAGSGVQTLGRNVVYGFHGEFFRSQAQAGQYMHYYDDGLFVGQFGESSLSHQAYEGPIPGFVGNGYGPSLVLLTNGEYYAWNNDESAHGPQRWHLLNARNIREQVGSGLLGGVFFLTNQASDFPVVVAGENGNQSGELSWHPVPGASSYNIYCSTNNGGPYNMLLGATTYNNFIAGGLTNGQTYYFVVTAVVAGREGAASEQVPMNPFDTSRTVICTGSASEGEQLQVLVDVSSTAPALGQPSYIGAGYATGVLNLRERDYYGYGNLANDLNVGTAGYVIYDWGGAVTNLFNITPAFVVTKGSGWTGAQFLKREYDVNNVLEPDFAPFAFVGGGTPGAFNGGSLAGLVDGLKGNPIGTLNILLTDTNFHYITVLSPAEFSDFRVFTMTLTSTNGMSASYSVNESNGYSHVFQFLLRGNATLTANASGGADAVVQALFFDNVTLVNTSKPAGPGGLYIVSPSSP